MIGSTSQTWRGVILGSIIFAIAATTLTWLVLADGSPLRGYFLNHTTIPNFVGRLLIVPYLGLILIRPSLFLQDVVGLVLELVQWLVVGFVFMLAFRRLRRLRAQPRNKQ